MTNEHSKVEGQLNDRPVLEGLLNQSVVYVGIAYIPHVENGYLSWTNDYGLPNPDPVYIQGLAGTPGISGHDGKSAYDLAVESGFDGTVEEWLASLVGTDGDDGASGHNGKSAYELAVELGYEGTLEQWLASLVGNPGPTGPSGSDGKDGLVPYISEQGTWCIGDTDTGIHAEGIDGTDGQDGLIPYIQNGNWWIGENDTGVQAIGHDGADGQDGKDGLVPYILNGNWWIGTTDTGVKAVGTDGTDGEDGEDGTDGEDGLIPYIKNGNWWIGETDTGIRAQGLDGTNGTNGVGIKTATIDANKHLILTLDNDATIDCGLIEFPNVLYSSSESKFPLVGSSDDIYFSDAGIHRWDASSSTYVLVANKTDLTEVNKSIKSLQDNKVDKVDGKGLSTEDYTTADKTKLANIKVPTKLSELTNDSKFIDNTVSNLMNYYLKTEVYTRDEIAQLIGQISTLDILVVESLPTESISTSTIYLLATNDASDAYDEYIYVKSSQSWDKIGRTTIDLSNYLQKNGDASNTTVTFTTPLGRNVPTSGDSLSTIIGKIVRYFLDLDKVAFSGSYDDLADKPSIPQIEQVKLLIEYGSEGNSTDLIRGKLVSWYTHDVVNHDIILLSRYDILDSTEIMGYPCFTFMAIIEEGEFDHDIEVVLTVLK